MFNDKLVLSMILMTFIAIIIIVLYVTSCFRSLDWLNALSNNYNFWVTVYPENGGISKVFIVQLKNQHYSFNATTAIDVCTSLGVSIASCAEVQIAQSNGFQTCRY